MIAETKNRLNIKDLIFNNPVEKKAYSFDPHKDLTKAELSHLEESMKEDMERLEHFSFNTSYSFAQRIMYNHVLFPDKVINQITEKRFHEMEFALNNSMQGNNIADCISIIKLTVPGKSIDELGGFGRKSNIIRQSFYDLQENISRIEGQYSAIRIARAMKVSMLYDLFQFHEESLDKMYDSLVIQIQKPMETMSRDRIAMIADFRIVDEGRYQKLKKENPEDFSKVWDYFKEIKDLSFKSGAVEASSEAIGAMAILSADSIKISENGIKLINTNSFLENDTNKIPVRRRF